MIWILVLIISFLLGLSTYLLFAPFYLEADSDRGLLQVRFHHLGEARLVVFDDSLVMNLRIARWTRQIDLLALQEGPRRPWKPRQKKRSGISWQGVKAIIRSFKVNRFDLNLDCGDVELNGLLFPLFFWISKVTGVKFRIDFTGVTSINFQIENNAARIIRAFILIKRPI